MTDGQMAYETFSRGVRDLVKTPWLRGDDPTPWEKLPDKVKDLWQSVATAVKGQAK